MPFYLMVTILVLSAGLAFVLNMTASSLEAKQVPNASAKALTDLWLSFFVQPSSLSSEQYKLLVDSHVTWLIGWLGVLGIVVIPVQQYKERLQREKQSPIRKIPVIGVHADLKVMAEYFSNAQSAIVFAGDYDWLSSNPTLKNAILKLSQRGRLRVWSDKARTEISQPIRENREFARLLETMKFQDPRGLKCSLIEYPGGRLAFLYRCMTKEPPEPEYAIFVVTSSSASEYLLQALKAFCEDDR